MKQLLKDRRIFTTYLPSLIGFFAIQLGCIFMPSDTAIGRTYWMETNYFMGPLVFYPIIILFSVAVLVWLIEKDIVCTKILVAKATITLLVYISYWWFYAAELPLENNSLEFLSFGFSWMLIIFDIPLNWHIAKRALPTAVLTVATAVLYVLSMPLMKYVTTLVHRNFI